jgi:hypothetical protein
LRKERDWAEEAEVKGFWDENDSEVMKGIFSEEAEDSGYASRQVKQGSVGMTTHTLLWKLQKSFPPNSHSRPLQRFARSGNEDTDEDGRDEVKGKVSRH